MHWWDIQGKQIICGRCRLLESRFDLPWSSAVFISVIQRQENQILKLGGMFKASLTWILVDLVQKLFLCLVNQAPLLKRTMATWYSLYMMRIPGTSLPFSCYLSSSFILFEWVRVTSTTTLASCVSIKFSNPYLEFVIFTKHALVIDRNKFL